MIDMEQTVYDILTAALPAVKWSVGFPQDFRALGEGLGSVKQMDNSVRTSTSSGIDKLRTVALIRNERLCGAGNLLEHRLNDKAVVIIPVECVPIAISTVPFIPFKMLA